jgi:uncharacterized protein YoxC
MTWEAFIQLVMETAPIWSTALVSIAGSVLCVVKAINKAKDAIEDMRADKTLKDASDRLSSVMRQNEQLIAQQNVLIDRLKQVEDYMEKHK